MLNKEERLAALAEERAKEIQRAAEVAAENAKAAAVERANQIKENRKRNK